MVAVRPKAILAPKNDVIAVRCSLPKGCRPIATTSQPKTLFLILLSLSVRSISLCKVPKYADPIPAKNRTPMERSKLEDNANEAKDTP